MLPSLRCAGKTLERVKRDQSFELRRKCEIIELLDDWLGLLCLPVSEF